MHRVRLLPASIAVGVLLSVGLPACRQVPVHDLDERIHANDNRVAAGTLLDDTLVVQLEARRGLWFPEADSGPSEPVLAFGETGKPLLLPGPMIRVRTGTALRLTIRNTLPDSTLVVHGLLARPGTAGDTIQVPAGVERIVSFVADVPGTYFYWGSYRGSTIEDLEGEDSQLYGAFIVDSTDALPADRVFVIGAWHVDRDTTEPRPWVDRDMMVINGKSWPHTERFTFATGDTVRWRWVNASADAHPMHLHGFYFNVESRGDWRADTVYQVAQRRDVVTELMQPGTTMAMQWVAARPGNWLFHCHFGFHVSHYLSLRKVPEPGNPDSPAEVGHSADAMRGLILGLTVRGPSMPAPRDSQPVRQVKVFMQAQAIPGKSPFHRYALVIQRGARPPAADSVPETSPPLVLRRGQPVAITIVNRLPYPSAIHWHGIELANSDADGVPGWSGPDGNPMRMIMPGDSMTVRFTPPRAGTFMYHSHSNEEFQIAAGLAGPLIVLDGDAPVDGAVDHTILMNQGFDETGRINGRAVPDTLRLAAGRTHRLRLAQIAPDWRVIVTLGDSAGPAAWRAVAKDGADLPAPQATVRPARVVMGPGETADFLIRPDHAGTMTLAVATQLKGWQVNVPVVVSTSP
jgi:FtsP/CotA-like multicopper oxidase with cupredoxin domain